MTLLCRAGGVGRALPLLGGWEIQVEGFGRKFCPPTVAATPYSALCCLLVSVVLVGTWRALESPEGFFKNTDYWVPPAQIM